ncbi:hypothetical protein QW131_05725 [Roseibium salinum]|nr:hypothetical protein [Roseibium salinum]
MLYYGERAFAPVWFNENGLTEYAHLAIATMAAANDHALDPNNYGPLELAQRSETAQTPEEWAKFDLDLSVQFLRYVTHVSSGRVQPNKVNKALNLFPHRPDPKKLFEKCGTGRRLQRLSGWSPAAIGQLCQAEASPCPVQGEGRGRRLHAHAGRRRTETRHERPAHSRPSHEADGRGCSRGSRTCRRHL